MNLVRNYYTHRVEDIDCLVTLVKSLEGSPISGIDNVRTTTIIKSSIKLALYNIVEYVVTSSLEKIHNEINSADISIFNLNEDIRKIFLAYTCKVYEKKNDIHSILDILSDSIDIMLNQKNFSLDFDKMVENYSIYSGNLDAKKIRNVFRKYSINISETVPAQHQSQYNSNKFGSDLRQIMKDRNQLAHGEVSFEEKGRISITELEDIISRIRLFLEYILDSVEEFINNKTYKLSP